MKIKLTIVEAKSLILKALGLPSDTEVVISRLGACLSDDILKCLTEIDKMDYNGSQKIAAIKRLRETCPCGLAEGKWVVEHWVEFKNFVTHYRRWPKFNGQFNNYTFK